MKKKVFRERYYKDIEHDGTNFGKSKVIEGKTEVIEVKPKKLFKRANKKVDK